MLQLSTENKPNHGTALLGSIRRNTAETWPDKGLFSAEGTYKFATHDIGTDPLLSHKASC